VDDEATLAGRPLDRLPIAFPASGAVGVRALPSPPGSLAPWRRCRRWAPSARRGCCWRCRRRGRWCCCWAGGAPTGGGTSWAWRCRQPRAVPPRAARVRQRSRHRGQPAGGAAPGPGRRQRV